MNKEVEEVIHAESFPIPIEKGKDIGEAVSYGFDLREWIDGMVTTQKI